MVTVQVQVGRGSRSVPTNRKYQIQVDPKPRAALYHVCRPRWKLLSPCPCHVLSLLLAVQWPRQRRPAQGGRVRVSCPHRDAVAAFGAGTATKKQLINNLQRFETINNLYVSSFNAIAKKLLLITIKLNILRTAGRRQS